jgi:hypothetical protein
MDPEAAACICRMYHQAIRDYPLDVLKLQAPKLRRDSHITHGIVESCAEPTCRICDPHTEATLTKLRTYTCKMYRLMTGKVPCEPDFSANENTPHFNLLREDLWCLDFDGAISASSKPLGDKAPEAREQMERLRALAILCDCVHTDECLLMAKRYRTEVDRIDRARKTLKRKPAETQEQATTDLQRIRKALRAEWDRVEAQETLDTADVDDLLYCATMFGMGADDTFAPLRTDWWRASYLPDMTVPGIDKHANVIEITDDSVWLRVPSCSKEPQNSVDVHVSKDSPLLAQVIRSYRGTALEQNDGFLFRPCTMSCRKSRRPRATMKLLRPGPCPHDGACTRCKEVFVCGKNGTMLCACTRAGKRARPQCGSYCGPACGHYTNIMSRHKRVCSALGNVDEREQLARNMGSTKASLERYGNGSGTV